MKEKERTEMEGKQGQNEKKEIRKKEIERSISKPGSRQEEQI